MRFKLTIFLIIANLITFGLIVFESGRDPVSARAGQSLFSAGITKVVVSGTGTAETFSLELRNKEWFVVSPFVWVANPFEASRLLNELQFLDADSGFSVEEAVSFGNTLANYGLEAPKTTVSVTDDSGTHILKIGNPTPDGRSVYVLTPDSKRIIAAPSALVEGLSKNPGAYRVKEIFSIRPYEVQAITERLAFRGGDEQRIGLVRQKGESEVSHQIAGYVWRFETPIPADADTPRIEKLLGEIASMTYARFIPNDLALLEQSGLKSPWLRFVLEGSRRSQTLLVGNPDPADKTGKTLFAKLEGNDAIFTVPSDIFDAWRNPLETLRDPHFFKFTPETLSAITITDDKNDALLIRRGGSVKSKSNSPTGTAQNGAEIPLVGTLETPAGTTPIEVNLDLYGAWQMPVAPSSPVKKITNVEPGKLQEFVSKLRGIRATNYPESDAAAQIGKNIRKAFVTDVATDEDLASMNFKKPYRKIELQFRDPADPLEKTFVKTLTIAAPVEPNSPYHAKFGTSIYSIDPSVLDVVTSDPNFFRSRAIYSLPEGAKIVSLRLVDVSGTEEKTVFAEAKPADAADWPASLSVLKDKRSDALVQLIAAVSNLSAQDFLDEEFSSGFSFDYQDSGVPEKWRYRLEIGVLPASASGVAANTEQVVYYFTKRLGGTFQLAGAPVQNCIFKIRQDLIDALHALTFSIDPSKDVPAISIPPSVDSPKK